MQGLLWMLVAQGLFAIMSVGARIAGGGDLRVPWQEVCASRFVFGALTALAVARLRGKSLRVIQQRRAFLRSGFGTLSAAGTFLTLASPELPVGDAVTLFSTTPVFVALLSWPLLGEKVRKSVVLAIGVAFSGILLIAHPTFQTTSIFVVIGTLTAVASGFAQVFLRKLGPGESSEAIVFHFAAFGSVVMLLASIPVWRTPDVRTAGILALTGLSAGLAQLAMTRAYSLDNAARVAAFVYSQVVFVRLIAVPIFGEIPSLGQVLGSLLVIASGVLIALRGHTKKARPLAAR